LEQGVVIQDGVVMASDAGEEIGSGGEGREIGALGSQQGVEEGEGFGGFAEVAEHHGEAESGVIGIGHGLETGLEVEACGGEISMDAETFAALEEEFGVAGAQDKFGGERLDHVMVGAVRLDGRGGQQDQQSDQE
jgi:hypothetical protein